MDTAAAMTCTCNGTSTCRLFVSLAAAQWRRAGEIVATATVEQQKGNGSWMVTEQLLREPSEHTRSCASTIPAAWTSAAVSSRHVVLTLTVSFETTSPLEASSWNLTHHPSMSTRDLVPRALLQSALKLTRCQQAQQATLPLPAPAACGFLDGSEREAAWSMLAHHNRSRWLPGCTMLSVRGGRLPHAQVLLLGDSQMRSTFEAMMRIMCEKWPYLDYVESHDNPSQYSSLCRRCAENSTRASRVESHSVCGGRLDIWGGGCRDAGGCGLAGATFEQDGPAAASLSYAWMADAADRDFSRWAFVNATRYDLVLVGSGMHNQNQDLAWSTQQAAAMFDRLGGLYPGSTVVNVGPFASDASKRKRGYAWAASLWRNHAMSHAFATAAASQGIASLRLLEMTLPVRSMTTDGVHLTWPHPLASVAAMVWHDVLFLLRRRETVLAYDRAMRLFGRFGGG